ncbi:(deoxy)nucleoside triphosphate pyrophosphohydrolase [Algoriphagus boritolerans]|uniref:(deoxy)nucleoside triphosphate pyrophosphohydrolase n=1 Tax=Algoriphagus boritolerans TaxID=308111 RepID=UPI000A56615F
MYFNCISTFIYENHPRHLRHYFSPGKVLAAKRSESMDLPGKWEFPGGKIEGGESPEECLIREIQEELAVRIKIIQALSPVEFSYTPGKIIRLIPFTATLESFDFHLLEHEKNCLVRGK